MCKSCSSLDVFSFLPAPGTPDFIVRIRPCDAVAEPARRSLHVIVGRASEAFQEGIRPFRLLA